MKRAYVAPELEPFGSIQEVSGVLDNGARVDIVYNSAGEPESGADDADSTDICCDVQTKDDYVVATL